MIVQISEGKIPKFLVQIAFLPDKLAITMEPVLQFYCIPSGYFIGVPLYCMLVYLQYCRTIGRGPAKPYSQHRIPDGSSGET